MKELIELYLEGLLSKEELAQAIKIFIAESKKNEKTHDKEEITKKEQENLNDAINEMDWEKMFNEAYGNKQNISSTIRPELEPEPTPVPTMEPEIDSELPELPNDEHTLEIKEEELTKEEQENLNDAINEMDWDEMFDEAYGNKQNISSTLTPELEPEPTMELEIDSELPELPNDEHTLEIKEEANKEIERRINIHG